MVVLTDYQIEVGGVVMGGEETGVLLETIEGVGVGDVRDMYVDQPIDDGGVFGREYRAGQELVIEGSIVKPDDPGAAFDLNEILVGAFSGDDSRKVARRVEEMRVKRPDGTQRVAFGRPHDYDPDIALSVIGKIPFVAMFKLGGPGWYSDAIHSINLGLPTSSSGGLVTDENGNIPSPIVTIPGTHRTSFVSNAGKIPTWPVVTVHGPIISPSVTLLDQLGGVVWWLEYSGPLAFDHTVTFDTRPWSRGVWLGDGTPVGGKVSRRSRLSLASIPPGTWEVRVNGTDLTGTALFNVAWRDAYRSI